MSIRMVANRLVQHGRVLIRTFRSNPEHQLSTSYARNFQDKIHVVQIGKSQGGQLTQGAASNVSAAGGHLGYLGAQARRIFVDNILKRVTNTLAADLRRKAAKRLLFGDSAPFFALVGVSLASGTGILTKDEELEGVCWEIREAVSKVQWNKPQNDKIYEATTSDEEQLSVKNFVIGPAIAKGSSAVVYAAKFNVDSKAELVVDSEASGNLSTFPFALKMMFNYYAESNAAAIVKAMYREIVPARKHFENEELSGLERRMAVNKKTLPPHPNIVSMYYVFTDRVPYLPDSTNMYPDALPLRLNPQGSGRNMSLFLLMKRYDVTLKEYIKNHELHPRESVLLLAQLLEGVAHMNAHGIAHRDLKSDNILLDVSEETDNCPSLAITDFGCCLADPKHGLYLPYSTLDTDKGGNVALMAPEVIAADPGPFTSINYTKADLWTVGTIAYEIFGMNNPFSNDNRETALKNYDYVESQLPPLTDSVPTTVAALIKNLLNRSLSRRLSVEMAATVMQLYLWAPNSWLQNEAKLPSSNEILQWLICLTTKVLCEGREISLKHETSTDSLEDSVTNVSPSALVRSISTRSCGRRTMPEYQLIASFLSRVSLHNVREGIKWIHRNT